MDTFEISHQLWEVQRRLWGIERHIKKANDEQSKATNNRIPNLKLMNIYKKNVLKDFEDLKEYIEEYIA